MRNSQMNAKSFSFSHRAIENLSPIKGTNSSTSIEFSDLIERGLKLAVYSSGMKTFRHRYTVQGKKRSMTLGEFPGLSLEKARERVRENKTLIREGVDPKDHKRGGLTFEQFLIQKYMPFAKSQRKSWRDIENRITSRLIPKFGNLPLANITKAQIASLHLALCDDVSGTTANRYLSLISGIFTKAIEWGLATENPARGISKAKEAGARTRVLSKEELGRFLTVLREKLVDDQRKPSARAIFLLLALGLRKMEVLSMKWENIDFEKKLVFLPDTKSGKARNANLNSIALELLSEMLNERNQKNPWVFPSRSQSGHLLEIRRTFSAILKEAQIDELRTHDLRRSFASNLINAGVSIYEIRDLLGHADIRTTQIYAHLGNETLQNASEKASDILNQAIAI